MHNAIAFQERGSPRAGVGCIEERDEALVGVLLRVSCEGPRGAPRRGEERGRTERRLGRRGVRGSEEAVELAAGTVLLVLAPAWIVLVSEEEVPQQRIMKERLERRVEETCLAEVEQPTLTLAGERGGVVKGGDVLLAGFP
jgi:hypothetical protein